jgi:formylglycine-generating enzyme required for sulfatase activity
MPVGGRDQSFVSVAGGMGTLGSKPDEPGRKDDEVSHQQTVNGPFFVATTLVTRGQFKAFVADTGFRSEAEKGTSGGSGWDGTKLVQRKEFNWTHPGFAQTDDHPVVIVTLADARAFAAWAAQKTGKPMRLPKEYEFEFAARAGTSTPWYGATSTKEALALGWFKDNTQPVGTRPVGTRKPNPLGLYDTTGLVFEWCDTPYGPYGETEPSEGKYVLRGGSFLSGPAAGRSAARAARSPGSRDADVGFRLVFDAAENPAPPATAPVAPVTPWAHEHPAPEVQSRDLTGVLLFLWPVAMLVAIVFGVRRMLRNDGIRSIQYSHDGFTIISGKGALGKTATYSYSLRGQRKEGQVKIFGEQSFVYVGARPQQVQVRVPGAGGGAAPQRNTPAWNDFRGPSAGVQHHHHHVHLHGAGHEASSEHAQSVGVTGSYEDSGSSASDSSSSSSSNNESFGGFPSAY